MANDLDHSWHSLQRCLRDYGFWIALAGGPVFWVLMHQLGFPLRHSPLAMTTIALVVIAYPILEEIVFRGAVQGVLLNQKKLSKSVAGISIACVITSIVFATAHLLQQTVGWAALIVIPSLVFGWARERHNTLYSPILLHIAYNAGFIGIFQVGVSS